MGFYGAAFTTIGIEIEGTGLSRDSVISAVRHFMEDGEHSRLQIGRDASVESFASFIKTSSGKYGLVSNHTKTAEGLRGFNNNKTTLGYELITTPLFVNQLEELIYPVMFQLASAGDFNSNRASIHFHVGYANNLRLLKNFLKVSLELEPVLYRLGGMGGTFRGFSNQCAYSRPLLNSVCVPVRKSSMDIPPDFNNSSDGLLRGKFARIINPIKALDANSIEEFWACFGVKYPGDGNIKYHPSRYCGTNLFAVPAHGTVEFRHCNKTGNPHLVLAIAKFLRGVVEMSAFLGPKEYKGFEIVDSMKEIGMGDASQIITKIYNMCNDMKLQDLPSDEEISMLLDTIAVSRFQEIPADSNVLTHIGDFMLTNELVKLGGLQLVDTVHKPAQIDIHTIGYVSIYD